MKWFCATHFCVANGLIFSEGRGRNSAGLIKSTSSLWCDGGKTRRAVDGFLPHGQRAHPVIPPCFTAIGDKPFLSLAVAPNANHSIKSAFIMSVRAGARMVGFRRIERMGIVCFHGRLLFHILRGDRNLEPTCSFWPDAGWSCCAGAGGGARLWRDASPGHHPQKQRAQGTCG